MSRDGGFQNADVAVDFLDDAKIRRVLRATRDDGVAARTILAYLATVLASWKAGERVSVADAAPLWLTAIEDLEARLVDAELVDVEGKVVSHAWDSWFGPAAARREARRFEGMVGGLMRSLGMTLGQAQAEAKVRLGGPRSDLTRSVPSVPSSPSVPSGPSEPLPTPASNMSTAAGGSKRNGRAANGHVEPSERDREQVRLNPQLAVLTGGPAA